MLEHACSSKLCAACALRFRVPVFVIAQEEAVVPGVQGGAHEQAHNAEMSHFPEATVGGQHASRGC